MLRAIYEDGMLVPEEPLDLPGGANVILQALRDPPAGSLGLLALTKVQAVYDSGVFRLRRPLKVQEGAVVTILVFSLVRPLTSFQGLLRHLKEDSVTLQHKAREWRG